MVLSSSGSKKYSSIVASRVKSFSKKPNKKTYRISPKRQDKDVSIASLFMRELYYGAYSRRN